MRHVDKVLKKTVIDKATGLTVFLYRIDSQQVTNPYYRVFVVDYERWYSDGDIMFSREHAEAEYHRVVAECIGDL